MQPQKLDISEIIKQLRDIRGLTQAELASKADLPVAAISHFETGLRKPSPPNLVKLAKALSVSVGYLLGVEDEMTPSGPRIEAVFRNAKGLSEDALHQLEMMSELLAEKERRKRGDSGGTETGHSSGKEEGE